MRLLLLLLLLVTGCSFRIGRPYLAAGEPTYCSADPDCHVGRYSGSCRFFSAYLEDGGLPRAQCVYTFDEQIATYPDPPAGAHGR
jgi:hypothetical protein